MLNVGCDKQLPYPTFDIQHSTSDIALTLDPLPADDPLYRDHPRSHEESVYVYPVLSRRAGGISLGVNLNRDQACTFDCVYCQVERGEGEAQSSANNPHPQPLSRKRERGAEMANPRHTWERGEKIDLPLLAIELEATLDFVLSGQMFETPRFRHVPAGLRRLNDIALSGDGEPTACPQFVEVVELVARERHQRRLDDVKLVLITNASLLHLARVQAGLELLDANGGEIWAKLDAGTESYYRTIARSAVPWQRILDNLRETARRRPIVIQTLLLALNGEAPTDGEIVAYAERLREIVAAGGHIKLVQLHTIARPPAETYAAPLANAELDRLAALVRNRTALPLEVFHSS